MKKGKNFLLLTGITCALALCSCGSKPSFELTINKDEGVNQVTLYDGETVFTDLDNVEEGKELKAVIDLKDDYEITAVELDGDPINVTEGSYVFTMPSKNATLSVETSEIINAYALTLDYDSGVASAKVYQGSSELTNLSQVNEGSELTLKLTLNNKFKVKEVKLGQTSLTGDNGEYSFVMPSKNETITITTEEIIYSYALDLELDNGVESAKVYLNNNEEVTDLSKIDEGTALYLVVEVKQNYGLSEVTLGETVLSEENDKFNFVMPSKNETLRVTTALLTGRVTVDNDETKGSYVLKVNGEASSDGNYRFGDTLSIEVTPNDGYKVANVLVNESPVSLTENVYEFEAALASYAIEISYAEVYKLSYKELSVPSSGFISESKILVNNVEYTSGYSIAEGDEVKVVLTAASQYNNFERNSKYFYLHVNNDVYHGDDVNNASLSDDFNTLTFNFTMPSNDVNLFLAYNNSRTDASNSSAISIELEENEHLSYYGYSSDDLYNQYGFAPTFVRDPGYVIEQIIITYEDGSQETLSESRYMPTFVNDVSLNWSYGARLQGNAKFTFVGEVRTISNINYVGLDEVKTSYGSFATSAVEGEVVSVSGISAVSNMKVISNITFDGVETFSLNPNPYDDTWSYSFTMPANEVTISFVFEDLVPLTYEANEHLAKVEFRKQNNSYSDNIITHAKAGSTVYVFVTAQSGYLLGDAIDENGTHYTYDSYYGSYQVVVGEEGLHLTFEVNVAYSISVDPSSTQYVRTTINGGSQAIEGATIQFTYIVSNPAKKIKRVYLADNNGVEIEGVVISSSNNGSYTNCSFTMPAQSVVISYELEDAASYNTKINFHLGEGVADTSVITSFGLYNEATSIYQFSENMEIDLIEGTTVRLNVGLSRGYKISATYTYLDANEESKVVDINASSVSNGMTSFNAFTVPANITSIDFTIVKDTPLTLTVTHDETITEEEFASIEYQILVNNQALEDGASLYSGDGVRVNILTSVDGYQYQAKITDAEGNTLAQGQPISTNITITLTKVAAYKFSIVNNLPNYGSVGTNLILSDGSKYYYDTTIYASGLTGSLNLTAYTSYDVDYVLTVGGEVVDSGVLPGNYSYTLVTTKTFNVDGDIVITYNEHIA